MSDKKNDVQMRAFVEALDLETTQLDRETLKRLHEGRVSALGHAALNEKKPLSSWALPALGAVASILFAAFVYFPTSAPSPDPIISATELEWLIQSAELELLSEDLAFYSWVDDELSAYHQGS